MREKQLEKRTVVLFSVLLCIVCLLIARLLGLILETGYVEAASSQSTYRVIVGSSRGRIYDCRMRSLAGGRLQYRAVIEPSGETIQYLTGVLSPEEIESISSRLKARSPFVFTARDATIEGPGVRVYRCETRYGENTFAQHLIGYLDGTGSGASGIEYAYDDYLEQCSGEIIAYHTVNSTGRSLSAYEPVVVDTTSRSVGGVVLTVDMDIQQIAEEAADEFIERGAIVVLEAQTGKIRACVSRPSFDQDDIAASLMCDDGQLVNRATAAYDIGSVFKLVVTAAALEEGIEADTLLTCEGSMVIGENTFHCSNRAGHGELDMSAALACSCNIYFIRLAQMTGAERILELAQKLGFAEPVEYAHGLFSAAGCLPSEESLQNPAALANFSFGQGELLATPLHISRLVAAVSNGGLAPQVSAYEALVAPSGELFEQSRTSFTRVMSSDTAALLRDFMRQAVVDGTGRQGASEYVECAAKTGTAQTGIIRDGRRVLQAWYAGFFPYDAPEYVCVVLVEDGNSGGSDAGPVFRRIADALYR